MFVLQANFQVKLSYETAFTFRNALLLNQAIFNPALLGRLEA